MRNVNDIGHGHCPACKQWKELTRYHPKDAHIPRKKKDKYCVGCITDLNNSRSPFYEIKKAISNHRIQAGGGDYDFKDLMALHKQQGGVCAYCHTSIPYKFSLDHIIPKKFGGKNILANMILTCVTCNSAKQHFEPFFFLRRKKYKLTARVIQRLKGAYDSHDYECIAACTDCRSYKKDHPVALCRGCNVNPQRLQARVTSSQGTGNNLGSNQAGRCANAS